MRHTRRSRWVRPGLESLETRAVLTVNGQDTEILVGPSKRAEVLGRIATANEVDLYLVRLNAGDRVTTRVSEVSTGSGLRSWLRVFDPESRQIATNFQPGGDPSLTFQASLGGNYLVGVSSAGNGEYVPHVVGGQGVTTGAYTLDLRVENVPLEAELAASYFHVDTTTLQPGESVGVQFRVENRGGKADRLREAQVVLTSDGLSAQEEITLAHFPINLLESGREFLSPRGLQVTLPNSIPQGTNTRLELRLTSYTSLEGPRPVPSANDGITRSSIRVTRSQPIDDLNVTLNIDHTFDGDLSAVLVSPSGKPITLFSRVGGSGDNFTRTVFDDEAGLSIDSETASAPFTGKFFPEERLSKFDGDDPEGWWTLEIKDNAPGDVGILKGWSLSFSEEEVVVEDPIVVTSLQPVVVPNGQGGTAIRSQLVVPDQFTIGDLDVTLDITHTFDSDLKVALVGPSGTRVQLFAQVGSFGENFTGTTLDDEAGTGISSGDAPFLGRFRPQGALADFDGQIAAGTWTLEVTDDVPLDEGTLNAWSLSFASKGSTGPRKNYGGGLSNPLPVPAHVVTTVVSELEVTGPLTVGDLDVQLTLDHANVGNVQATLISPSGTRVRLFSRVGGEGDDFAGTILDDDAADSIELGQAPFAGAFRPEESLRSFYGKPFAGTWKLELVGLGLSEDKGLLREWSLKVRPPVETTEKARFDSGVLDLAVPAPTSLRSVLAVTDAFTVDGVTLTVDIDHPDVANMEVTLISPKGTRVKVFDGSQASGANLSGTVFRDGASLTISSGQAPFTGVYLPRESLAKFAGEQGEGNWTLELRGLGVSRLGGTLRQWNLSFGPAPVAPVVRTYDSQEVPRALPKSRTEAVNVSTLTITDSFLIGDVTALVDIVHTWDGDLTAVLISPRGTRVTLFSGVGSNGDDFRQTRFDDQAGLSIRGGAAPFAGTFRPQDSLSAFVGQDAKGVWKLEVTDSYLSLDDGTLQGWSLSLREATVGGPLPSARQRGVDHETITIVTARPAPEGTATLERNSRVAGQLAGPAETRTYPIYVPYKQLFTATVLAVRASPRLRLLSAGGETLIESPTSDAGTKAGLEALLEPGYYYLAVSARTSCDYELTITDTEVALPRFYGFDSGSRNTIVTADFNGDGLLDVATGSTGSVSTIYQNGHLVETRVIPPSVSIYLGQGDGSFQPARNYTVSGEVRKLIVADVNNDGRPDVVVLNGTFHNEADSAGVSLLLGLGGGRFRPTPILQNLGYFSDIAVADMNGDGLCDIVTTKSYSNDVNVFHGDGNGGFLNGYYTIGFNYTVGSVYQDGVTTLAIGDVNGDGRPDILLGTYGYELLPDYSYGTDQFNYVQIFLQGNNKQFHGLSYRVREEVHALAIADVNGDGHPDVVGASGGSFENGYHGTLSVFLRNPKGGFIPQPGVRIGLTGLGSGLSISPTDLNADGLTDLVISSSGNDKMAVLFNNRQGGFSAPRIEVKGASSYIPVIVADMNGDGRADLVTPSDLTGGVAVTRGNGDGTFVRATTFSTGKSPEAVAAEDVSKDGHPDLVVVNRQGNSVSVLLGRGDGTFAPGRVLPVMGRPVALVIADVNRDGNKDIVVANRASVSVLLGLGDGRFAAQRVFAVGTSLSAIAVADFTGDGLLDVIVTNRARNGTVIILRGMGNGNFVRHLTLPAGVAPVAVAVEDLDGDRHLDIVVANCNLTASVLQYSSSYNQLVNPNENGNLCVLYGNGHGGVKRRDPMAKTGLPVNIAIADINGDGRRDLVVVNSAAYSSANSSSSNYLTVYLNDGKGGFAPPRQIENLYGFKDLKVARLNGDDIDDVVVTGSYGVNVLYGNREGTFTSNSVPSILSTRNNPTSVAVEDVNGDTRLDLVTVNATENTVGVYLAQSNQSASQANTYVPSSLLNETDTRNTPFSVLFDRDEIPDIVVLDRNGNILLRRGLGDGVRFSPPEILNRGRPARDIVPVRTGGRWAIAALDATTGGTNYSVTLYGIDAGGAPTSNVVLRPTVFPTRILAADLAPDPGKLDELILLNSLDNSVSIAVQQSGGTFSPEVTRSVGTVPTAAVASDVDGDHRLDLVVIAAGSGDVSVIRNDDELQFSDVSRFRAGFGTVSVQTTDGALTVKSPNQLVSLVAGRFNGGTQDDLVVLNRLTHQFTVLENNGQGGFSPPKVTNTTSTSLDGKINERPGAMVSADFNRDGSLDVAVLMEDRGEVWVFLGNNNGTFTPPTKHYVVAAGSTPTGMSLVARPDGLFDLLIGNPFGDVLRLQNKGNGTFAPPEPRTGTRSTITVLDRDSNHPRVLVVNQSGNRVTIQAAVGSDAFVPITALSGGHAGLQAPGNAVWARLDGPIDPFDDIVVLGSGSNDVLVYRGLGGVDFAAPVRYPVGTNPTFVSVIDLNGDGYLDLVVTNEGSNDLSILFGRPDAPGQFTAGPRLQSNGVGPIGLAVRDVTADGVADLVVTNSQSDALTLAGNVTILPGRGLGFFDDRAALSLALPAIPTQPLVFLPFGPGVVTTTNGGIVAVDPANQFVGVVYERPGARVAAFDTLSGGRLAVVYDSGELELLGPGENGRFVKLPVYFRGLSGEIGQPTALKFLETEAGDRILVASAGSEVLGVFAPLTIVLGPTPLPGPVVHFTEKVVGNPLLVVSTLLITDFPDPDEFPGEEEADRAVAAGALVAAARPFAAAGGGEEEDIVEVDNEAQAEAPVVALGADRELRELRLPPVRDHGEGDPLPPVMDDVEMDPVLVPVIGATTSEQPAGDGAAVFNAVWDLPTDTTTPAVEHVPVAVEEQEAMPAVERGSLSDRAMLALMMLCLPYHLSAAKNEHLDSEGGLR